MHKYVEGHWAASSYDLHGTRTDHKLYLGLANTFEWSRQTDGPSEEVLRGA